jgi:hypothetical protein
VLRRIDVGSEGNQSVSYGIFKSNPERFRIDDRLKDPDPRTTWLVTRYRDEIKPGDVAFIWKTGREGGVCGTMRVDSGPELLADSPADRKLWVQSEDSDPRLRVRGTFLARIPCLTARELRKVSGLENLSVFHGFQQATNFRVTPEEGEILMRLVREAAG